MDPALAASLLNTTPGPASPPAPAPLPNHHHRTKHLDRPNNPSLVTTLPTTTISNSNPLIDLTETAPAADLATPPIPNPIPKTSMDNTRTS